MVFSNGYLHRASRGQRHAQR